MAGVSKFCRAKRNKVYIELRRGLAWHGGARRGVAGQGKGEYLLGGDGGHKNLLFDYGKAGLGEAGCGLDRLGLVRQGKGEYLFEIIFFSKS